MLLERLKLHLEPTVSLCGLVIAASMVACTGADFSGQGGTKGSRSGDGIPAVTGGGSDDGGTTGTDGPDGPDGIDGMDGQGDLGSPNGPDSGSTSEGADGNPDAYGADDSSGNDGGLTGGDEGGGGADLGGDGDGLDGGTDLDANDGGMSLGLTSDLTISTNPRLADECDDSKVSLRVEAYVDGRVRSNKSIGCPKGGKSVILPKICRKNGDTCLKVTIIGKKTQDTWGNQLGCVFVQASGNQAVIDFDSDGAGFLGSCQPGEDDQITLRCQTKNLHVQNCD